MDQTTSAYVQQKIAEAGNANFASEAAEQSLLGNMLTRSGTAERYCDDLTEQDFYLPDNGKIFAAIKATVAKGQSVDIVTVDATLGEMVPEAHATLTTEMLKCATGSSVDFRSIEDYIEIIRSLSRRRQTIVSMAGILERLKDPTQDLAAILDQMRTEETQINQGRAKWQSMTDVIMRTYTYLEQRSRNEITSISTGINNVDGLIGGFFAGELTVIGARPSVGKSAFGASIALSAARNGYKIGIVSREMTDIQYGQRIFAHDAWVDGMSMRRGDISEDDWEHLTEALGDISKLPISFLFTVATVEDLRREVQRRVEEGTLDMLVVDYLQLMRTRKNFREEHLRVGYISKALKDMAVDFNIPVVALAQVNRDTDGVMPSLKSLKASGDIEQDADGVIFLHRPRSDADPDIDPRDKPYFNAYNERGLAYICIAVAKQRQGATGRACVLFDPAHMRYMEIERGRENTDQTGGATDGGKRAV